MKYRITNNGIAGKAFKGREGIEIVAVGKTRTLDLIDALTPEFIAARAAENVRILDEDEARVIDRRKQAEAAEAQAQADAAAAEKAAAEAEAARLDALKAEATELGVEFNSNIGFDTLKERVDAAKAKAAEPKKGGK